MTNQTGDRAGKSATKELNSLEDAILYGIKLHQNNQLEGAESLYLKILEMVPDQPDVLHYLGMIRYQQGRPVEAIRLILQAIERAPNFPDFYNNTGNIFISIDNVEAANASYLRAIDLAPERADLHNNLGVALQIQGDDERAEAAFRRAIELDTENFRAYNNLGRLYVARGDSKAATRYYCTSITLNPRQSQAHELLGIAYRTLGQIEKATEVFRSWLEDQPDNPVARHYYLACSGENVPDRASDGYIEQTFDAFAASFEDQLKVRLSYKAPELTAAKLLKYLPPPDKKFDILDAGCGTGLCGPLVAAYAARLVGVDLSNGMLQKAQGKECYDQLIKAELIAFLDAPEQAGVWDVIISADTLCYFGPLESVSSAAYRALKTGGLFAFSVEDGGGLAAGHAVNPSGRYAHDAEYVRNSLQKAGFEVLCIDPAILRTEAGHPVCGLLVVGQAKVAGE